MDTVRVNWHPFAVRLSDSCNTQLRLASRAKPFAAAGICIKVCSLNVNPQPNPISQPAWLLISDAIALEDGGQGAIRPNGAHCINQGRRQRLVANLDRGTQVPAGLAQARHLHRPDRIVLPRAPEGELHFTSRPHDAGQIAGLQRRNRLGVVMEMNDLLADSPGIGTE